MRKIILLVVSLFSFLILTSMLYAVQLDFFEEGKIEFKNKNFIKSKFFFEKNIIFHPKHEFSYLYLAKIHNNEGSFFDEEINLNNVLLINPKNDEAIYMLILLKINQSDYEEAQLLIDKFDLVCKDFCSKKDEIKKKLKKSEP